MEEVGVWSHEGWFSKSFLLELWRARGNFFPLGVTCPSGKAVSSHPAHTSPTTLPSFFPRTLFNK